MPFWWWRGTYPRVARERRGAIKTSRVMAKVFVLRRSRVRSGATEQRSFALARSRHYRETVFLQLPLPVTKKRYLKRYRFLVVGRGRFELPKSETSDLQSDPFGHSGIFPYMKLHRRAPRCLGGQGRASLLRLRNQTAMRFLTMELVIGIEPTTC